VAGGLGPFLLASLLPAQEWTGDRSLRGTVTDTQGRPIKGAAVELRLVSYPAAGPPATTTDKKGKWRILRLAPGRYELHIKATGFININGWATLQPIGVNEPVEAQMLPLSWETPAFSAGQPHTMRIWVEKGNSLLEQGHPAKAREQYERALAQLPRVQQPEVLRSIARTHYLEGQGDLAAQTLRQALEVAPTDNDSRDLFVLLMEEQGRTAEAEEFLSELESRPPEPVEEPAAQVLPPQLEVPKEIAEILDAPPDPPQPHRVGSFKTSFSERSQWSRLDDFARRMRIGTDVVLAVDPDAGEYRLSDESFQVIVPEVVQPAGEWGLLVWISPTRFGGSRRPEVAEALARHRLIWIGANHAGNERMIWERIWLALDAATNMQRLYEIDPERIYVGGYSGGGRMASRMGVLYPELVRGAWSLYGCDYFRPLPAVERPGTFWPAAYQPPTMKVLDLVKRRNRFVLVTGTHDFNFILTRSTAREMEKDGFSHVTYLEIPDATHYTFPDGEWLDRIFAALEQ